MKIVSKVILFTVLVGGLLFAYSSQNGIVSAGEEIEITPQDGHSFNVKRVSGSDANYDIEMSNKGNVYYSQEHQVDDVYLVFHNDVVPGDRIKIHVNSGSFSYSFSAINALPKMVKKALYKKAVNQNKSQKPKRVKKKVIHHQTKKKEEPIVGEFVEDFDKKERKKEFEQKVVEQKSDEIRTHEIVASQEQEKGTSTSNKNKTKQKVLSDSFYSNFTKIFKDMLKKFSTPQKSSHQPQVQKSVQKAEKEEIEALPTKANQEELVVDQREIVHEATMIRGDFSKLPSEIEIFDDSKLQESAKVEKKVFPKLEQEKVQELEKKSLKTEVPTILPVTPSPTLEGGSKKESLPIQKSNPVPTQAPIQSLEDKFKGRVIGHQDRTAIEDDTIDTGYKDEYSDLNKESKKFDKTQQESSISHEGKVEIDENKIVITKILDKEKNKEKSEDIFAGRVLGKMDDRVLGGGYDPDSEVAKFGVRATKNSLPVSAWIEVFKDGTKKRVKTFYTSDTRKTKKIKLPAGVYMIRATYRTRSGKLQKTLKHIHLKSGGDITKHITFNEGKLKVVSKRGDKPLYVKVVVYRSGTKERVTYEFSDRESGVALLSLATGDYDIEVIDHEQKREFATTIRASKTETINADF